MCVCACVCACVCMCDKLFPGSQSGLCMLFGVCMHVCLRMCMSVH
jgi:hypothetical protein